MDDRDLGRALHVLRVARGWRQDDLARAAEIRGSSISKYESGKAVPDAGDVARLVAAMGFQPDAVERARRFLAELRGEKRAGGEESAAAAAKPEDAAALEREAEALQQEIEAVAARAGRLLRDLARRAV